MTLSVRFFSANIVSVNSASCTTQYDRDMLHACHSTIQQSWQGTSWRRPQHLTNLHSVSAFSGSMYVDYQISNVDVPLTTGSSYCCQHSTETSVSTDGSLHVICRTCMGRKHTALWLFAVLRLRNTLTYLLTYLHLGAKHEHAHGNMLMEYALNPSRRSNMDSNEHSCSISACLLIF